ncbi:MAG: TRM11 family methyltransferase [Thermoleophilia bacterium]
MQLALPTVATSNLNPSWLPELAKWPSHPDVPSLDLSLANRSRVSALPWRGQFSPETASRLLSLVATSGDRVLDPFVGSGTTLLEAARRGLSSIGLDVNPAAVALARAALWARLPPEERRAKLAALRRDAEVLACSPGRVRKYLRSSQITDLHSIVLLGGAPSSALDGLARLETLVLSLPQTPADVVVHLSDARRMPLAGSTIDVVVTSPPYINVFNYHQFGRPLTDDFGWPVLAAARSEIGSNRARTDFELSFSTRWTWPSHSSRSTGS